MFVCPLLDGERLEVYILADTVIDYSLYCPVAVIVLQFIHQCEPAAPLLSGTAVLQSDAQS